ncbi:MAG: sensor histidine kinase [Actinophytocola sp.]|uniref:sensor histidine kinase n=1 Tax=Actinophytocola sp. TaxID=1872138 RepID=UPI0013297BBD|nr:sensor histidine kinase [Actinophytocola sp.]MPZ81092.1 sensor histidine kinase [Actinophytocola sp.]
MAAPPRAPRGPMLLAALPPYAVVIPLAVIQVGATFPAAYFQELTGHVNALTVLLTLLGPLCLLRRRSHPLPTLAAVVVVTVGYLLLRFPVFGPVYLSVVVAVFNAVLHGPRLLAWLSAWWGVAVVLVVMDLVSATYTLGVAQAAFASAWLTLILVLAEIVKARNERMAQAETARAEQTKRQASEERLRIAREVHDVLAHHVSLINVQSGVALHLIDEQPEQARQALSAIKQSSKEVLVELRNILGVLQDVDGNGRDDGSAPRQPVASLDQLDRLLERMREAGLPVNLDIEGDRRPLPSGVDAAALRIVQESLTNTYRHAGPTQATVVLSYLPEELRIRVDDNGRGDASAAASAASTAASSMGSGHGLTGMRQRTEALGGTLTAGPRPGGGFRVAAAMPTRGGRRTEGESE